MNQAHVLEDLLMLFFSKPVEFLTCWEHVGYVGGDQLWIYAEKLFEHSNKFVYFLIN